MATMTGPVFVFSPSAWVLLISFTANSYYSLGAQGFCCCLQLVISGASMKALRVCVTAYHSNRCALIAGLGLTRYGSVPDLPIQLFKPR